MASTSGGRGDSISSPELTPSHLFWQNGFIGNASTQAFNFTSIKKKKITTSNSFLMVACYRLQRENAKTCRFGREVPTNGLSFL